MATRSRIGILNTDGTVTSIYCHWDGYPSHNGRILRESYTNEARVRALLAPGNLSSLQKYIGTKHDFDARLGHECTYYGRDRGDTGVMAKTTDFETFVGDLAEEYQYLFDPKTETWACYAGSGGDAILTEADWAKAMQKYDGIV